MLKSSFHCSAHVMQRPFLERDDVMREESSSIPGNGRGQSTVEFLSMMVLFIVTVISFFSATFLASQALLAKYVSYAAARGAMAYSNTRFGDRWTAGVREIERIVPNRRGPSAVARSGEGVQVTMTIEELIPGLNLAGDGGTVTARLRTELGTEPAPSGDNRF